MSKQPFTVIITETAEYSITVQATDVVDAIKKANQIFEDDGPETSLPCTVMDRGVCVRKGAA